MFKGSITSTDVGGDGGSKGSWRCSFGRKGEHRKHPVRIMITDLEELGGELTHFLPVLILVGPEIFVLLHHAFEEFPSLFVNSLLVRVDLFGSYGFDKLLSEGECLLFSGFYLTWDIW